MTPEDILKVLQIYRNLKHSSQWKDIKCDQHTADLIYNIITSKEQINFNCLQ